MKKITALMTLILILTMCNSAFADSFSIHSGVQFGMTKNEIIALESANGFEARQDSHYGGLIVEGKIAGYHGSDIRYSFKDNALTAAHYHFGSSDSNVFSTIKETLVSKYGTPLHEKMDGYIKFDTYGLNAIDTYNEFASFLGCDIRGFSQWLYPIDGGYVDIMLMQFTPKMLSDYTVLSYSFVTEEAYQKKIEQVENTIQDRNDDL